MFAYYTFCPGKKNKPRVHKEFRDSIGFLIWWTQRLVCLTPPPHPIILCLMKGNCVQPQAVPSFLFFPLLSPFSVSGFPRPPFISSCLPVWCSIWVWAVLSGHRYLFACLIQQLNESHAVWPQVLVYLFDAAVYCEPCCLATGTCLPFDTAVECEPCCLATGMTCCRSTRVLWPPCSPACRTWPTSWCSMWRVTCAGMWVLMARP